MIILRVALESYCDIFLFFYFLSVIFFDLVHDKPLHYVDLGDGDIEINYYRSRGIIDYKTLQYDALVSFFEKCDRIMDHILSKIDNNPFESSEHSFSSLISG